MAHWASESAAWATPQLQDRGLPIQQAKAIWRSVACCVRTSASGAGSPGLIAGVAHAAVPYGVGRRIGAAGQARGGGDAAAAAVAGGVACAASAGV
jgi:hypothetical protein